jgi:hypothetical protein
LVYKVLLGFAESLFAASAVSALHREALHYLRNAPLFLKRLSKNCAASEVKRLKKSVPQKTEKLHNTASKMAIPKAKRFTISEGLRNTCAAKKGKAAQHAHKNMTPQPSLEIPKLLQNPSTRGGPSLAT